jgi:hypothetical protein
MLLSASNWEAKPSPSSKGGYAFSRRGKNAALITYLIYIDLPVYYIRFITVK